MTQFRGIFGILTASYKEDMSLDEKVYAVRWIFV